MIRAVKWGRPAGGVHRGGDGPGPDPAPEADGSLAGDGLAAELAAAAGRRWWNRATLYLGAVALLIGGFLGGVLVQKSYGDSTASGPAGAAARGQRGAGGFAFPGGMPTGFPGGAGNPGAANPGAGGASVTTGTVKLVDGTTLYVQTEDGTVVTVRTSGDTAIKLARDGALKDLKAGDEVTVEGADTAGTVTATTVTGPAK